MPDSAEKTEKATPKKREDARKKGQVLKSAEVNTAVMVLSLFTVIAFLGGGMVKAMSDMLNNFLTDRVFDGLNDMAPNMSPERLHNFFVSGFLYLRLYIGFVHVNLHHKN